MTAQRVCRINNILRIQIFCYRSAPDNVHLDQFFGFVTKHLKNTSFSRFRKQFGHGYSQTDCLFRWVFLPLEIALGYLEVLINSFENLRLTHCKPCGTKPFHLGLFFLHSSLSIVSRCFSSLRMSGNNNQHKA